LRIADWGLGIAYLMDAEEFKARTQRFALDVIRFVETLSRGRLGDVLARQLIRSPTSVGANHRAACRAKSRADFISKLGTVEEEADESICWLELLVESGTARRERVSALIAEADEILAMTVAAIRTAKSHSRG
jgi:four helix bundle protein